MSSATFLAALDASQQVNNYLDVSYMLVCSLYVVAVQSRTHKGAFVIILQGPSQLPLRHLYLLYYLYLTHKTVNYSSNSIKHNLRVAILKKVDAESLRSPPKAKYGLCFQTIFPFLMIMATGINQNRCQIVLLSFFGNVSLIGNQSIDQQCNQLTGFYMSEYCQEKGQ